MGIRYQAERTRAVTLDPMRRRSALANRPARIAASAIAVASVVIGVAAPAGADDTIGGDLLARTHRTVQLQPGADPLPDVWAETWIIADATTGEVLAQKSSHVQRPPASTLKMLTAVTVMPRTSPDDVYRATPRAAGIYGARVGLRPGKAYTMDELWYAVFLPSANDAAVAVAQANGGVKKTVRQMNDVADELGALDTVAKNTSGLDAPGQLSSAYDLAVIARAGMARDDFSRYAGTVRAQFPDTKGKGAHTIYTTNRLMMHGFKGMIGVKTGFTTRAGRTYVGAARRGETTLLVALMGIHESSEEAAKKLLRWGFANHDAVTPIGALVDPGEVTAPVAGTMDTPTATSTDDGTVPTASEETRASGGGLQASGSTTAPTSNAALWGAVALAAAALGASLVAVLRRRRSPRGRHAG